ncbi:hypothetical protein LTR28_005513, partial [Elasticomyces elasticus]
DSRGQQEDEREGGRERREPVEEEKDAKSERALEKACKATVSLIRRSFKASRVEIVGRPAMEYVNRREAGASNNDRPFYGKQKVQTLKRYSDKRVKILRYVWQTEGKRKRPDYRLTRRQREGLAHLRHVAARVVGENESREVQPEPDPSQPPESGQRGQRRRGQSRGGQESDRMKQQLVQASMSFWIAMFDHELRDREYESAVLSGLAVLGTDTENGGWMPAIDYTPILAATIMTLRAIVIRHAWRIRRESIRAMMRNGTSEDAAREQAPGVLAGVQEMVHQFMTLTTFGGKPTPLNRIFQQKTYGMKIRYATKAEGQIWWEGDDTFLVRKIKFSMNDIRTVAHGLNSTVRPRLVEDLLLFEGIERSNANEWRPTGMP